MPPTLSRLLTVTAVTLASCVPGTTADPTPSPTPATDPTTTSSTSTTTTLPPRVCTPQSSPVEAASDGPQGFSLAVSEATFPCADTVVLASEQGAWTGAAVASSKDAPLLVVEAGMSGAVAAELHRLEPEEVVLVDLDELDRSLFQSYRVTEREATVSGAAVPTRLAPNPGRLWLAEPEAGAATAAAWAAAHAAGDTFLPLKTDDLRAAPPTQAEAIRAAGEVPIVPVGPLDPALTGWQLEVVRRGAELPGGGQLLFPGRRLVAFYGSPLTPALGVLGEQGPEEAADRLAPIAAEYEADGVPVVPTFEIIATVASARPGADGDYSAELTVEELRPWVEVARERGFYVVLDLQPGRTDFLPQAQRYTELLIEPHVGLALDPEWRLGPNQVHLRQIGSVDGAEVNRVVEWLAGLVREHALPQKLLLVHQFKLSMITNRDLIETPPELAVVIQMDGQGPLPTKYDTWNAIRAGTDGAGWWWGWKNFYDEDSPTATPAEVLDLDPVPVFVSYQ